MVLGIVATLGYSRTYVNDHGVHCSPCSRTSQKWIIIMTFVYTTEN